MGLNPELIVTGCDVSVRLVQYARERSYHVCVADALRLPYRDSCFDATMSIAVIHHLSSAVHRMQALKELVRVVRVGGDVLVTAWAYEQQHGARRAFEAQDVFVPWHLPMKHRVVHDSSGEAVSVPATSGSPPVTNGREVEEDGDVFEWDELPGEVDASRNTLVVQRYCHVFVENEIDQLFEEIPNVVRTKTFYDTGNWCVMVRKTAESGGDGCE